MRNKNDAARNPRGGGAPSKTPGRRSARRQNALRVLAVDPGYDRLGVAVMEKNILVHSACFSPPAGDLSERLRGVYRHVTGLIREYAPDSVAIETLFFTKNQKTAIAVAEARGVIMLAAAENNLPLFEYSPQEVKIAVTGSGSANKDGVIKMVTRLIALSPGKRRDDEYDAIALALAHQARARFFHSQRG